MFRFVTTPTFGSPPYKEPEILRSTLFFVLGFIHYACFVLLFFWLVAFENVAHATQSRRSAFKPSAPPYRLRRARDRHRTCAWWTAVRTRRATRSAASIFTHRAHGHQDDRYNRTGNDAALFHDDRGQPDRRRDLHAALLVVPWQLRQRRRRAALPKNGTGKVGGQRLVPARRSQSDEVPIYYDVAPGDLAWLYEFGKRTPSSYHAPYVVGKVLRLRLRRQFGLRNVEEGIQSRSAEHAGCLVSCLHQPPKLAPSEIQSVHE